MQGQDRHRVIAIDGPAASGKSSVARQLARRLDFVYVNSGAMYRAITWSVLNARIDPADKHRIAELMGDLSLGGVLKDRELHLLVDNVDLTEHLHEDRVNRDVSPREHGAGSPQRSLAENARLREQARPGSGGARHRFGGVF